MISPFHIRFIGIWHWMIIGKEKRISSKILYSSIKPILPATKICDLYIHYLYVYMSIKNVYMLVFYFLIFDISIVEIDE